ncbi:4-aminobutyrate--2-oxoglutarate transaminase [Paracoccus sp. PARArs4]|uniref:4-aminobutyrate--2-oxoglutarate transaminase n=1 Tax=Paracoccus sp. PARArs4 TaxID=2853442 RepID=UPI0024A6CF2B|nr:4-aminobutyrate--2-oxoglutarate transaminase [Paracoccus sp. PARArs4]
MLKKTANSEIEARRKKVMARGVGVMTDHYATRALNSEIWDADGNRLIDFASGIAVLNTGHRHPRVMQAVEEQLRAFTHTCHQVVPYENYVHLAERLTDAAPGDFDKKAIFVTTGAEALENAVKIARAHTGRQAVVTFHGAFHGRTFMTMSMTGKVAPYKAGFGPMMPDVFHVPFPNPLHGVSVDDCFRALDGLFKSDLEPSRVAAIVFEPVQGEGGFNPAPAEFTTRLRALCDEHGIVMIADEVQTGFARTGSLLAMDRHEVAADMITMAKSLGGGFPIAAVVGRAEIMDAPAPGGLGGTYGGNPLGIAAAHAVLDIIRDEDLCARAEDLGARLKDRLRAIQGFMPEIADIRGPGFMVAIELMHADGTPAPDLANAIRQEALSRGLLLLTCGVHGNVIRFLAPITIPDDHFDEAMEMLQDAARAVKGA